jgi:hypothetical protein
MEHTLKLIFLATVLLPEFSLAETYRCTMNHEISVGANGRFVENKEANKGKELFIAIDNRTQKGTLSSCTQAGCSTDAAVAVLDRYVPEEYPTRTVRLMVGEAGQLWSVEGRKDSSDFTAVAVSAFAQRSDTSFGNCRLIIK